MASAQMRTSRTGTEPPALKSICSGKARENLGRGDCSDMNSDHRAESHSREVLMEHKSPVLRIDSFLLTPASPGLDPQAR